MTGVGHWRRSDEELLRAVAESEARMRREYAASLSLIAELDARDVAAAVGYSGLALLLRDVARISTVEARRRISQATAVTETPLVSGGVVPAALPATAAALTEGVLGGDHVEEIAKVVRELPLHVPDTDRELAEPLNELHLTTRRNGRLALRGDFDPEASALITTVLSPLAKPRPSSDTGPDPRTAAERHGDALVEVFGLAADSGALPSEAGEKPHILVTVPLATLRTSIDHPMLNGTGPQSRLDQRGTDHALTDDPGRRLDSTDDSGRHLDPADEVGRTDNGRTGRLPRRPGRAILDGTGPLDAESARRIACDARIIPVVLGSRSEPLDLGRSSYTVPTALRRALVLRDRGCAFPGCDRPHRHCHGHHIQHWADDGPTELDNLVLLCGRHHRLIHHSDWDCVIANGRAEFRPPRFVDATRKPRHNLLHVA